jgi:hypothetical protein
MKGIDVPLILKSMEDFETMFLLDPEALRYEVTSRALTGVDDGMISGIASLKEKEFTACYKYHDALWVLLRGRTYLVTPRLNSRWKMNEWEFSGGKSLLAAAFTKGRTASSRRFFDLILDGAIVEHHTYLVVESDVDSRPFVIWDAEDEDFLLWLHNTLSSPERQAQALRQWK